MSDSTPNRAPGGGLIPPHLVRYGTYLVLVASGIVVGVIADNWVRTSSPGASPETVSGTAVCPLDEQVVGVYVKTSDGADGGFADWRPDASLPNMATFTAELRDPKHVGTYIVSVGCGGTPQRWRHGDVAPLVAFSAGPYRFDCSDQPATPGNNGTLNGTCLPEQP